MNFLTDANGINLVISKMIEHHSIVFARPITPYAVLQHSSTTDSSHQNNSHKKKRSTSTTNNNNNSTDNDNKEGHQITRVGSDEMKVVKKKKHRDRKGSTPAVEMPNKEEGGAGGHEDNRLLNALISPRKQPVTTASPSTALPVLSASGHVMDKDYFKKKQQDPTTLKRHQSDEGVTTESTKPAQEEKKDTQQLSPRNRGKEDNATTTTTATTSTASSTPTDATAGSTDQTVDPVEDPSTFDYKVHNQVFSQDSLRLANRRKFFEEIATTAPTTTASTPATSIAHPPPADMENITKSRATLFEQIASSDTQTKPRSGNIHSHYSMNTTFLFFLLTHNHIQHRHVQILPYYLLRTRPRPRNGSIWRGWRSITWSLPAGHPTEWKQSSWPSLRMARQP